MQIPDIPYPDYQYNWKEEPAAKPRCDSCGNKVDKITLVCIGFEYGSNTDKPLFVWWCPKCFISPS